MITSPLQALMMMSNPAPAAAAAAAAGTGYMGFPHSESPANLLNEI